MESFQSAENICVFGLGVLMQETRDQLRGMLGREPDFYCDNDPAKWGQKIFGKLCLSPHQLEAYRGRVLIIIAVKQYEAIWDQLTNMGFENLRVANFDRGYHVRHFFRPAAQPPAAPLSAHEHFKGHWAFVTGSSRGIGQRIAVELAKMGCNLILHGRKLEHLEESQSLCRRQGVQVELVESEFSNLKAVDRMLESVLAMPHQVGIVVNNAAVSPAYPDGVWSVSGEEIQRIFTINAFASVRVIQKLVPPMLDSGFGRVLNVTSHIQFRPNEMMYTLSKAALDCYSREMSDFLKDKKVDFSLTTVDPGWVKTDAGGPQALHAVDTIVPGILMGIVLGAEFHGHRFNAQDFKHLTLDQAINRARLHLHNYGFGEWI